MVLSVAIQMLGRPGRSDHRNCQASRLKRSGTSEPGRVVVTVSRRSEISITTSGSDVRPSSPVMALVRGFDCISASLLDPWWWDEGGEVEHPQISRRGDQPNHHQHDGE